MTPEQKTKYIKYGSYALALGIVGYVIYRWKFAFNQKSLEQETFGKLLSYLGPTFSKKKVTTNTEKVNKGPELIVDTVKIGNVDYVLDFFPYIIFNKDREELKLKRIFTLYSAKPPYHRDKLVFMGTWKLSGDKLIMTFYPKSTKYWSNIVLKKAQGKTISGNSLTEVLQKSSGESNIKLDALKK